MKVFLFVVWTLVIRFPEGVMTQAFSVHPVKQMLPTRQVLCYVVGQNDVVEACWASRAETRHPDPLLILMRHVTP